MELACTVNSSTNAKPFIKWAGGKGQLLETFKSFYPFRFQKGKIKKYIEPFLGGGAVLFDVLHKYRIEEAFVFDINEDLINTYKVVKYNVDDLVEQLANLEQKYLKLEKEARKNLYYEMRKLYNSSSLKENQLNIKRASQFIFLNRTCFNGLYRVNRKGLFNVPSGDYKNPTICDTENLYAVNIILQRVNIFAGDYKESIKYADRSSFVYFDPPYKPLNDTSSFTSYSKFDFSDQEQIELAHFFVKMHSTKAWLMLSNSDTKNINPDDDFFDNLYGQFYIKRVQAKRAINANANRRGFISEILVTNYRVK